MNNKKKESEKFRGNERKEEKKTQEIMKKLKI